MVNPTEPDQDGANKPPAPKLEPLTCKACGGPVPLGEGDVVTCPYCHKPVPIPPDYQKLRDAARQSAQAESALAKVYERLGQPPSPLLRFWGSTAGKVVTLTWKGISAFLGLWLLLMKEVWDILTKADDLRIALFIVLMPFAALYAVLWLVARFIHLLAVPLGIDLVDVLSLGWTFFALGGFLLLVMALPKALFEYLESFASVRRTLQACLCARPPSSPGGPARCRSCGAALAIPTGALGVRCVYCQTDNLVALPNRWVARVQDRAKNFYRQVLEAELEEDTVRRAAGADAMATIIIALVMPFVLGACGFTMVNFHLLEGRVDWKSAAAGPRELLPHTCTFYMDECTGEKPGVFDLAVRRGDTVELTYQGSVLPATLLVRHMNSRRPVRVVWDAAEDAQSLVGHVVVKASGWLILDGAGDKERWQVVVRPTRQKRLPIE